MPRHDLSDFDDMVVFKNPDGSEFSMDPRWNTYKYLLAQNEAMEAEDEADEAPKYETWTNDELRAELVTRELSPEGKKVDLIARLRKDDELEDNEDEEE